MNGRAPIARLGTFRQVRSSAPDHHHDRARLLPRRLTLLSAPALAPRPAPCVLSSLRQLRPRGLGLCTVLTFDALELDSQLDREAAARSTPLVWRQSRFAAGFTGERASLAYRGEARTVDREAHPQRQRVRTPRPARPDAMRS